MNAVNAEVLLLILLVSFSAAHANTSLSAVNYLRQLLVCEAESTFFPRRWAYDSLIRHDMSASF